MGAYTYSKEDCGHACIIITSINSGAKVGRGGSNKSTKNKSGNY